MLARRPFWCRRLQYHTASNASNLKTIIAGETKYPAVMSEEDVAMDRAFFGQISDIVKCAVNIKSIALWNHPFTNEDCLKLCKAIANCKKVHSIKLESVRIDDQAGTALGQALIGLAELKILNVNDNAIGISGAVAIAKYIQDAETLIDVMLNGNTFGGKDGLEALGRALAKFPREHVEVSFLSFPFLSFPLLASIWLDVALQPLSSFVPALLVLCTCFSDSSPSRLGARVSKTMPLQHF